MSRVTAGLMLALSALLAFTVLPLLAVFHALRKRAALLLPLLLSGCATLQQPAEIAWQSLHAVDMAQTVDGMRDSCVRESHPITRAIIGDKPSTGAIVAYGIGSAAFHAGVSHFLETRGLSRTYAVWQVVSIADTAAAIGKGWSIGIRLGGANKTGCT